LGEEGKMPKKPTKKLPYVICRCHGAGVHAGELASKTRHEIVLLNSRCIWYWSGPGSLSEIAVYGCAPDKIADCRFGAKIRRLELRRDDAAEIIYTEPAGEKMIRECPEWRA
jgi:hypothetical protein